MGVFKNLEIEIVQMYFEDGLKEKEIAKVIGLPLSQVHQILFDYESREMDYDECDVDFGAEHY
jgi:hypothetical protein